MTKEEYLQNKGVLPPDLGVMYIVFSTRAGVTMKTIDIWEVKEDGILTRYKDDTEEQTTTKKYTFKEAPFELIIPDDMPYGEDHGYGTGSGDLWGHSYFGTLDKEVATRILQDESNRVRNKYQLIF